MVKYDASLVDSRYLLYVRKSKHLPLRASGCPHMATLADVLTSLSLESHLQKLEDEELNVETLTWMAIDDSDGTGFVEAMAECGMSSDCALRLKERLQASQRSECDSHRNDTQTDPLKQLLHDHGLEKYAQRLHDEELCMDTLSWMAIDSCDEFLMSMDELDIARKDSECLHAALVSRTAGKQTTCDDIQTPSTTRGSSGLQLSDLPPPSSPVLPTAPSVEAQGLSQSALPDHTKESVAITNGALTGKRVLISGLSTRRDLNGRCGTVLFHDAASGRCMLRRRVFSHTTTQPCKVIVRAPRILIRRHGDNRSSICRR